MEGTRFTGEPSGICGRWGRSGLEVGGEWVAVLAVARVAEHPKNVWDPLFDGPHL